MPAVILGRVRKVSVFHPTRAMLERVDAAIDRIALEQRPWAEIENMRGYYIVPATAARPADWLVLFALRKQDAEFLVCMIAANRPG